jgi:hypothetical protein
MDHRCIPFTNNIFLVTTVALSKVNGMNDWKKLTLRIIAAGAVLFFVYSAGCALWFASTVKSVLTKASIISYEKLGIQGINKVRVRGLSVELPIPITIELSDVVISNDKLMLTKDARYQVRINVKGGHVILGSVDEDFEGYKGERFEILPFAVDFSVKNKGIEFKSGTATIDKVADIRYEISYALKYVSLLINLDLQSVLFDQAQDAKFFKQAFDPASGNRTITLRIQGETPLLRVDLKAPLMALNFAYSLD